MFNGQSTDNTGHATATLASNMDEQWETRSHCSSASRSSQRSNTSVLAAKARAKAEAARAQASFAEKEAEMIKEQAHIEAEAIKKKAEINANLHALRLKGAAAAAIAEAEVLEAAAEDETGNICFPNKEFVQHLATHSPVVQQPYNAQVPTQAPPAHQETKDNGEFAQKEIKEHSTPFSEISEYEFKELPTAQSPKYNPISAAEYSLRNTTLTPQPHYPGPATYDQRCHLPYNKQSPMKIQPRQSPVISANQSGPSVASDLAKYLIRRELVSSGLLMFDEKPEHYWAWKASFHNATEELSLTPREELDLLCKWLGPKSSELAKRIRAVHICDATAGIRMLWQRLEDSYGSPEAIENALLTKLEEFPKISNRENHKLRELGDLLTELDAARLDGFLPGLSYLDTSRGITPIVQKLPYHLQEKWITAASHYKEQYNATYPPFPVFVKFVCDKAKTLNDPSFAPLLFNGGPNVFKPERLNKPNFKHAVSVCKTDLTGPDDCSNLPERN